MDERSFQKEQKTVESPNSDKEVSAKKSTGTMGDVMRVGAAALALGSAAAIPETAAAQVGEDSKKHIEQLQTQGFSEHDSLYLDALLSGAIDTMLLRSLRQGKSVVFVEYEREMYSTFFSDPDFLKNVLLLRSAKVNVLSIITNTSLADLSNEDFIRKKLKQIPRDIVGKIDITHHEFNATDDELKKRFEDPNSEFRVAIEKLSSAGVIRDSKYITDLIALDRDIDTLATALSHLQAGGVTLEMKALKLIPDGHLTDQNFLNALIELVAIGEDPNQYWTNLTSGPQDYGLTPEITSNPDFFLNVSALREAGVDPLGISHGLRMYPHHDLRSVARFIRLLDLKFTNDHLFYDYDPEVLNDDLVYSLIDTHADKDNLSFIHSLSGAGKAAKEFVKRVRESKQFRDFLKLMYDEGYEYYVSHANKLTPGKMSDPEYRKVLFAEGNRISAEIDTYQADRAFVKAKTGTDRNDFIKNDAAEYARVLQTTDSPALKDILLDWEDSAYLFFTRAMDREDSQERRLSDLKNMNAVAKFRVLAIAGEHAWTSTKNLIYDGYHIFDNMDDSQKETKLAELEKNGHLPLFYEIKRDPQFGDGYTFIKHLEQIGLLEESTFYRFVERLAEMGKLDSFFELIGTPEQQKEIFEQYFLGMENSTEPHFKAATLSESLRAQSLDGGAQFIVTQIESAVKKLKVEYSSQEKPEKVTSAILWYELIVAGYYQKLQADLSRTKQGTKEYETLQAKLQAASPWTQSIIDKHRDHIREFDVIKEAEMFPDGVHIRYHTFFNNLPDQNENSIKDKDGHNSLQTTIERFGGDIKFTKEGELAQASGGKDGWKISAHTHTNGSWRYVLMTKTVGGRKMINIMNSPKMNNQEVEKFFQDMSENFVDENTGAKGVQGFVMRGHNIKSISSTAVSLFEGLSESGRDIVYTNFGSCGGYTYGKQVLESQPTFFFGTQATGYADVNINVQMHDMNTSLETGEYNSIALKAEADERFSRYSKRMKDGYAGYRWPHENNVMQLFASYNSVMKQRDTFEN